MEPDLDPGSVLDGICGGAAGKLNVTDIFDSNKYAHDPRRDFMNRSLIDARSFDYAADAWGYTYGAAAELYPRGRGAPACSTSPSFQQRGAHLWVQPIPVGR
jgi:hypothetical protein